jgi:hypothetical protein
MDVPTMTPIPGSILKVASTTLKRVDYQTIATIAAILFNVGLGASIGSVQGRGWGRDWRHLLPPGGIHSSALSWSGGIACWGIASELC